LSFAEMKILKCCCHVCTVSILINGALTVLVLCQEGCPTGKKLLMVFLEIPLGRHPCVCDVDKNGLLDRLTYCCL